MNNMFHNQIIWHTKIHNTHSTQNTVYQQNCWNNFFSKYLLFTV